MGDEGDVKDGMVPTGGSTNNGRKKKSNKKKRRKRVSDNFLNSSE
jgi:hypothetical protein